MRSRNKLVIAIVFLVVLPLLAGCLYSREIVSVKRDLQRSFPDAHIDGGVSFTIGPLWIGFSRWVMGFVADDDVQRAREYLGDLHRVKVGVFDVDSLPDIRSGGRPVERLEGAGWQVAVAAREEEESVWVLYRERRERVEGLYVVVLSEDELVIARLYGRLDRIVEKAVADYGPLAQLIQENVDRRRP